MINGSVRFLWAAALITFWSNSEAQELRSNVKIVGAMKDVMWKGQLSGTIALDTIQNKQHLFGLGPVEYLAGEIVIVDGQVYKATLLPDSTMKVEETYSIKAPFLLTRTPRGGRKWTFRIPYTPFNSWSSFFCESPKIRINPSCSDSQEKLNKPTFTS